MTTTKQQQPLSSGDAMCAIHNNKPFQNDVKLARRWKTIVRGMFDLADDIQEELKETFGIRQDNGIFEIFSKFKQRRIVEFSSTEGTITKRITTSATIVS